MPYKNKEDLIKWKLQNKDKIRTHQYKWLKSDKGKLYVDKHSKHRVKRTPEYWKEYVHNYWKNRPRDKVKRYAQSCVQNAIKSGKLIRLPCIICGNVKSHGHHPDYSKPLDVIWLCKRHHLEAHGF